MLKKIGVLTSGGDAPGMNAAIRAVVRSSIYYGLNVYGIRDGYQGLYDNNIHQLKRQDVSDTINSGGTFLGSARFKQFKQDKVCKRAINNLQNHGIEAMVVIGGDGTYRGAKKLTSMGIPCIGLPGTIDNDIAGTDYTIGFDTALNTVVDAIDRLRDTSSSHRRISVIEVMGRYCGDLALYAAIAAGSEYLITPEVDFDKKALFKELQNNSSTDKKHAIIVITEHMTNVNELAYAIEAVTGRETRATILGHVQRGGKPTARDRVLATRMGEYAVKLLCAGKGGLCVGLVNEQLINYDITECVDSMSLTFAKELYDLSILVR